MRTQHNVDNNQGGKYLHNGTDLGIWY